MMVISEIAAAHLAAPQREKHAALRPSDDVQARDVRVDGRALLKRCFYCDYCGHRLRAGEQISLYEGSVPPPTPPPPHKAAP